MSYGLTPRQADLLAFLTERQHAGGAMPSYDEMAAAINLRSKSGVSRMIDEMVERGVVRRMPGRARAIEIVPPKDVIDPATELALETYCHVTGVSRQTIIVAALREYFQQHPMPTAAGGKR